MISMGLRPDASFDFSEYILAVKASNSQMVLLVFATILNSALIIRIVSFYLGVLAITQYTNSFLRQRISELIGDDVIRWNGGPAFSAKVVWIPLRALSQSLFILIAEFLTVFVLIEARPLLNAGALYICGWVFFGLTIFALVASTVALPPTTAFEHGLGELKERHRSWRCLDGI